jgi:glycosyltransferase involved in cell wall biosynthesis
MIRALINSVNGCIVWNSKIEHRNRVVLPDVLDSNAIRKNEFSELRRSVIFSGSLGQTTGFEVVLEYFSKHAEYHLVITGRPYNYSTEKFQELIDKFVTPYENILYLGLLPMDEYYRILDSVDIALSFRDPIDTQHDGNFPSKILEYLSFGKIVISTKQYFDIDSNIYFFTKPDELYIDKIFEEIFNLSEEEIGAKRKYIYNYLLANHTENALISAIMKVSK